VSKLVLELLKYDQCEKCCTNYQKKVTFLRGRGRGVKTVPRDCFSSGPKTKPEVSSEEKVSVYSFSPLEKYLLFSFSLNF
jgi:hypothetical protein